MKKILVLLICLLFPAAELCAQNGDMSPPGALPPPETRRPANGETGSPGPVTPGQIKSFLSGPEEESYIILNFDNADLKDVISTVGAITNENFILSPGLDARITIHSAKKIPISEVMNVFESVLEVNGMALVRSGDFYKVVSGNTAKQKPLEVRRGNEPGAISPVERPVTQIIPVQFVPVSEVSTVLTPLLSQFGSIIPNPRNNLLIVNDLSSSIVRMLKVLKEIDVNAFKNTRMSFFKPKYSDVLSLTNELTEVLNALNLTREGIAVVPIERINSLVVFSASPTLLKTVEGWIRKLDEEVMTGQNVFVYPVQNVKAESIANILNTLYQSENGTASKVTAQKTETTAKQSAARRRIAQAIADQKGSGSSRVEIITFEPTNSLVILAPPGVYREMVETIKRIDMYPREVLIEAIIAEVSISDSDQYGVQWSVLYNMDIDNKDITGYGQGTFGNAPVLSGDAPTLVSQPGSGFSYLAFRPDRLVAMVHALASESKVNILSSPRLLVRDQEEASIEVGSEIPTASSTTSSLAANETLTQNIEYRTVGIKLNIKPTISEEKTVVLDIEQEVSSKGENQQVGQTGNTYPTFNTTKTKTSIVVPDKQGIVIGGIMEEENNESYEGIPLLSSIPIFGSLFRYTVDTVTKSEIVIIIVPHVVADRTEADALTKNFMEKLRDLKVYLNDQEQRINIPGLRNEDQSKDDES